jgi:tetratricopeptide (TPR) repeat protein
MQMQAAIWDSPPRAGTLEMHGCTARHRAHLKPPDVAKDYINRGNAYDEAGMFNQAIADYSLALELLPGYGETYYNRGIAYEHNKKTDEAKADFLAAYYHGLRTSLLRERFLVYALPWPAQ